jgi:hypothetical protein
VPVTPVPFVKLPTPLKSYCENANDPEPENRSVCDAGAERICMSASATRPAEIRMGRHKSKRSLLMGEFSRKSDGDDRRIERENVSADESRNLWGSRMGGLTL